MFRSTLSLLATALAAAALACQATAAGPPQAHSCGSVTGAHWSLKGQSGSRYQVKASSPTTCAFARSVVPRLTRSNINSGGHEIPGTPPGYSCAPLTTNPQGIGIYFGFCAKGGNALKGAFNWAPLGLHLH